MSQHLITEDKLHIHIPTKQRLETCTPHFLSYNQKLGIGSPLQKCFCLSHFFITQATIYYYLLLYFYMFVRMFGMSILKNVRHACSSRLFVTQATIYYYISTCLFVWYVNFEIRSSHLFVTPARHTFCLSY